MTTNSLSPWKRFVGLIQLERKDTFQIAYFAIFEGLVALSLPLGIQAIINLLQGAQVSASWVVLVFLVTLGVAFSGTLKLMQLRIIETIQQRIFTRASFELSYRFPKIKMKELEHYYLPELANRFFDTLTIQKGLSKILIDVPSAFLQIVFALFLLSFYHPFFIIFGILLILLVYIVFKFTAQRGIDTSLQESKNKYKVVHWLQEVARSVISFKLSGKTNLALQKNDELVKEYLNSRESHFKILVLQFIQMISFKVLVTAGLLLIGGYLVLDQKMNIGQFVAAEIIVILVISSVEKLILGLESFYDVLTSIEKLGQVTDKSIENQKGEIIEEELHISIENVTYKAHTRNEPILNDVSFEINQKDRILIEGKSVSSKASFLRLILGLIEPTSGSVHVNNLSVDSLNIKDYRSKLGISFLNETPFEGTLRENITLNDPNISDKEIYEIFEVVGLVDFLKLQPNGLNTVIEPEGRQVAYSINKKIILARAIAKNPKLLILEDPVYQLKTKEVERIVNYITDPIRPWGLIVVSNDSTWKEKCSKHLCLDNGNLKINSYA